MTTESYDGWRRPRGRQRTTEDGGQVLDAMMSIPDGDVCHLAHAIRRVVVVVAICFVFSFPIGRPCSIPSTSDAQITVPPQTRPRGFPRRTLNNISFAAQVSTDTVAELLQESV